MLCLDGGGIRGLVILKFLDEIEKTTGKRITELFDWIVGTSTGGIIAIALSQGIYNSSFPPYIHYVRMSVTALEDINIYFL